MATCWREKCSNRAVPTLEGWRRYVDSHRDLEAGHGRWEHGRRRRAPRRMGWEQHSAKNQWRSTWQTAARKVELMNGDDFDALIQSFDQSASRRLLLGGAFLGALGYVGV